jgi:hypothetical protein
VVVLAKDTVPAPDAVTTYFPLYPDGFTLKTLTTLSIGKTYAPVKVTVAVVPVPDAPVTDNGEVVVVKAARAGFPSTSNVRMV